MEQLSYLWKLLAFSTLVFVACGKKTKVPEPSEPNTQQPNDSVYTPSVLTQRLYHNLKLLSSQNGTLLGHQASPLAGANGWRLQQYPDGTKSDFKDVCGKFPALVGFEFASPANEPNLTFDFISYDQTITLAKQTYARGGVVTFSFHPYRFDNGLGYWETTPGYVQKIIPGGSLHGRYQQELDKWAAEFAKLTTTSGELIPFILRLFHEMDASWFWWGTSAASDEDFKTLFRYTVKYLRAKGLNNMLVCYAPGYYQTQADYLKRYPGDDLVDILAFDTYYKSANPNSINGHPDWSNFTTKLQIVSDLAAQKQKIAAIAETGQQNITSSDYFTQLKNNINATSTTVAYVMFWANYSSQVPVDGGAGFYVPYSGMSNAAAIADFTRFVAESRYMAAGEHPDLYR